MTFLKRKWRRNWLIFGGDGVFHVENCNFRCGNGVYRGGMASLDKNGVFLAQLAPFMTKMAPRDGNGAPPAEMAPHRRKWLITGENGSSPAKMAHHRRKWCLASRENERRFPVQAPPDGVSAMNLLAAGNHDGKTSKGAK